MSWYLGYIWSKNSMGEKKMLSPQHSSYTGLREDPLTSAKLASPYRQLALKYDCHAAALRALLSQGCLSVSHSQPRVRQGPVFPKCSQSPPASCACGSTRELQSTVNSCEVMGWALALLQESAARQRQGVLRDTRTEEWCFLVFRLAKN